MALALHGQCRPRSPLPVVCAVFVSTHLLTCFPPRGAQEKTCTTTMTETVPLGVNRREKGPCGERHLLSNLCSPGKASGGPGGHLSFPGTQTAAGERLLRFQALWRNICPSQSIAKIQGQIRPLGLVFLS